MSDPLRIEDLRVSFQTFDRSVEVLRGVDLVVREGEVVGLVGEYGSGKSTLVNAVVGLLPRIARASGAVEVFGRDLAALPFEEQQPLRGTLIGTIVSGAHSRLNPMARVGDQISNVLRDSGSSKKEARARAIELLETVGIPDPARRARAYPHELSGGMAQRVVIAIALSRRPRFVIADEPTSGLDVTIQADVLELIGRLIEEVSSSTLIATRDLGIVAQHCSRVAVLERGRIIEDAPVQEFFAGPRTEYGRMLLDAERGAARTSEDPGAAVKEPQASEVGGQ